MSSSKTTPVCTFEIVLREVFASKRRLVGLGLSSLMHAAGHGALALFGGAVVVMLGGAHPGRSGSSFMDAASPGSMHWLLMAAMAASATRVVGSTASAYLAARTSGDVTTALRGRVLTALFALHRLRRTRHDDHGRPCGSDPGESVGEHARAVGALTFRIREVASAFEHATSGARAALQIVMLAVVGWLAAPRLFAVAALVLVPFGWILGRARRRVRAVQRDEMHGAEALIEAADEAVRHGDLWRSFGAKDTIARHIDRLGREARDRAARLAALASAQTGANELLGVIAVMAAIAALGARSADDLRSLGAFAVPFFLAYRPMRELAEARIAAGRARLAARALDEVFAAAPREPQPVSRESPREWPLAAIEIVGLAHPHAAWSPLTTRIGPGAIVAIVGPTGAGKSTLLRLLLGLEPAAAGTVTYDGRPLGDAPGPHARPFAWVPQDAPILAASLDQNVLLRGEGDSRALLASLGATSLLDLGDEPLGEGRRPLSGGERQWVSIARALATSQPVLLLDEPTAGLDPEAERKVLAALAALRGTRTVIIVTHREAPAKIADRVIAVGDAPSYFGGRSVVAATTGLGTQRKLSSKTLEL